MKTNLIEDSLNFYNSFKGSTLDEYRKKHKSYFDHVDRIIIDRILLNNKRSSLLDIGCGDGVRAKNISGLTGIESTLLIDNCQNMVDICNAFSGLACKKCLNSNAIISDAESFNFNKKFDVILCLANLLGHLNNVQACINNIFNHLSEGGIAFVEVNNKYHVGKYGLLNVLKNIFGDLLRTHSGKFKIVSFDSYVYLHNPFELDSKMRCFAYEKFFINNNGYSNMFNGNLLYVLKKRKA